MDAEQIGKLLDQIGDRIGPAGERAWQVGVQYTAVSAWLGILLPLVVMIISIPSVVYFAKKTDFNSDTVGFNGTAFMISSMLAVTSIMVFFMSVGTNLPDALVPEWGTIRRLIETLNGSGS